MAYYKIKNITANLPKRHQNRNTEIKVEYMVGFQKKIYVLPVSKELVLSCKSLPVQIHALRVKNLVNVVEISENEFMKLQKPSARKTVEKVVDELEETDEVEETDVDGITTTQAPNKKKSQRKKQKSSTIFLKPEN